MPSLEEVAERIKALPAAERAELERNLLIDAQKWVPNPGAQTEAYLHPADIMLYGGAANGGKSDLILGLALTQHRRSLILRRKYVDLSALTERAIAINGTQDGFNGSPPPKLRTTDGRLIEFGAANRPGDEQSWQGRPHDLLCVHGDTLVALAGGGYRAMRHMAVGDLVQTLEGPRRVNRVLPVRRDESVLLQVYDERSQLVAEQVQSTSHRHLTDRGWLSAEDCDVCIPPSLFGPTVSGVFRQSRRLFSHVSRETLTPLASRILGALRIFARELSAPDHLDCTGIVASDGQSRRGIASERSCESLRGYGRPLGLFSPRVPLESFLPSGVLAAFRRPFAHGADDDLSLSGFRDWLDGCLFGPRRCGERTRPLIRLWTQSVAAQESSRPQAGAEQPTPNCSAEGARGRTPTRSRPTGEYVHPYTMESRPCWGASTYASFSMTPNGVVDLYDIEVDEVNHFITKGGIVNKNCFDEAAQFTEAQIRFLLTWNRPIEEGVRARCVLGSNPPVTADGQWLISMFRPWLDPVYHNPAKPGELRWFVTDPDGNDVEVEDGRPHQFPGQAEPVSPRSRTFIPASYKDNPLSASTNYKATLDSLPEPLRSAMRDGNFMIGRMDAERQVIPSAWIMEAQARWTPKPPEGIPMTAMGIDPAAGGKDDTVLAPRHDWWFAPVIKKPGKDTPFPIDVLNFALMNLKHQAKLIVDCSGGYGGGVIEPARTHHGLEAVAFKGAEKTMLRTRDRQFGFRNKRAASLWAFREALDPSQEGGSPIALPPDPELLADLSAPTFELTPGGILIEEKQKIRERIGRSTGKGDSVTMSWWTNGAAATFAQAGTSAPRPRGWTPRVVMGHQGVRRLAGR